MAATEKGVWDLQDVRDKQLQSEWSYDGIKGLWVWGRNHTYGGLGLNQGNVQYSSPVQMPGTTWSSLEVGYDAGSNPENMGALRSDGTLWRWGHGGDGQLAQNNRTQYSSPVQIGSWTDWAASDFGHQAWGGVRTDGTLWMSGNNSDGQLAQNEAGAPMYSTSSPTQVPGTTWSTEINGAIQNWIAIKTDNTLWSWGFNDDGSLGQNSRTKYSSPIQVGTDTDWSKVGNAYYSQGAIKTDGTLWVWGSNGDAQLGLNQQGNKISSPTQVPGTWSSWSTTDKGSGGIKTDGTLWTWGSNYSGQLGLNSQSLGGFSSPCQVGTGTDWSKINIGNKSLGLKTDGTLWSWGDNSNGGLGQNQADSVEISSPVQVPGYWIDISASAASAIALTQA